MIDGGIYTVVVPVGRTLAGFIAGVMLGIFGGWMALNFNQLIGYVGTKAKECALC